MKTATRIIYGINGTGFLLLGIVLLLGSPRWISDPLGIQVTSAALPKVLLHNFKEAGCLVLFASLLCLWHTEKYEDRQAFHWSMTFFWFLMAIVHTVETIRSGSPAVYAIVNGIPLIAYLITAPRRKK